MSAKSFFSDLDESEETPSASGGFFSDLPEEPSRLKSLLSAFPKGLIKGAAKFSPLQRTGPVPQELGERLTEQFLPTQKDKTAEDILEFAGEAAPFAAAGPGGLMRKGLQAAGGGLAKKGAKELGLPEWAQDLVGGAGMLAPEAARGALAKGLKAAPSQQSMVNYLKSKGLSEKDIVPIIQDPKKLSILSKGALKFSKKDPFIQGIKGKAGAILEDIREKGLKTQPLSGENLTSFMEDFGKITDKIPRRHSRLMRQEMDDLMNHPISFSSLRDFDIAVNDVIKDATGGKASLGMFKEPINKAMKKIDPELFKDLEMAKKAYSNISRFADKMTKKNWEWLIDLGAPGALIMKALMWGGGLKAAAVGAAGRYLSRKALTSPRMQNMHRKLWDSVLHNKFPQSMKLVRMMGITPDLPEESDTSTDSEQPRAF